MGRQARKVGWAFRSRSPLGVAADGPVRHGGRGGNPLLAATKSIYPALSGVCRGARFAACQNCRMRKKVGVELLWGSKSICSSNEKRTRQVEGLPHRRDACATSDAQRIFKRFGVEVEWKALEIHPDLPAQRAAE